MKKKRIEWIDIFRGLLIYLVVLGHCNNVETLFWIYSFHMSAFFIISGYTIDFEKYDLVDFIKHKFKKLIIPFISINILFWLIHLLISKIGFHSFLFSVPFDIKSLSYFFKYLWTIDFAAATWFLYILFLSSIILKFLYDILKRKSSKHIYIKMLITTFIFYLLFYILFYSKKEAAAYNLDLVPMAMFFITSGICLAKYEYKINKYFYVIFSLIGTIYSIYYGFTVKSLIEWSSRSIPNTLCFFIASFGGFIIIKNLALFINYIFKKFNKKEKLISYAGKNSIDILMYHFVGFKIVYVIFYKIGIIAVEQVSSLTPAYTDFWLTLLTSIIATVLSLIIAKGVFMIKELIIKFFKYIKNSVKKNKNTYFFISLLVFILLVVKNFLIQGIMCNDEVLLRINGQYGIKNFLYNQIVEEEIRQGRILGAFGNLKILSFLSDNIFIFRTIGIIVILIAIILLGVLSYRIIKNKWFSFFVSIMALAFIPITFEPSIPNAYIIVICQPLILLLLSLILYIDYFSNRKKWRLILSAFLFFWGCCLYEFVVTYLILFIIITYLKDNKIKSFFKSWLVSIMKSFPHIITAIFYLFCYVMQRRIFPTQYSGTKMAFTSFGKILNVFKTEFLSSLPGYYLTNNKYKYLYNFYKDNVVNNINTYVILIIFGIIFSFLMYYVFKNRTKEIENKTNKNNKIIIILTLILYAFLPVLPNSLTELYQNTVSPEFFISIPVSFYLYFSIILLICYLLWNYVHKYKKVLITILASFVVIGISVQLQNSVFSTIQYENYNRFVSIEEFFKISYWKYVGEQRIEAPSLYETKNTLAIEPTHWTRYNGSINIGTIVVESIIDNPNWFLEMQDDNSFYLYNDNEKYYITKNDVALDDIIVLRKIDKTNDVGIIKECFWDENNFRFYRIEIMIKKEDI